MYGAERWPIRQAQLLTPMRELQTSEVNRLCFRKIDLVPRFASNAVFGPEIIIVKTIVGVGRRVALAIEIITMGWTIPIMGRNVFVMGTRIRVVRLAAIILMERRILIKRAGGILVMRDAIKLLMFTKLVMRVEVVVVHGAISAMMRLRVKAFVLLFVIRILVPMVRISMLAARILWFVGGWIRTGIGIDWRPRGTLHPIMPRRTGRTRRARRAIIGRRARRRWRRGWRGRRRGRRRRRS